MKEGDEGILLQIPAPSILYPLLPIGRYQSLHLPLRFVEQGRSFCRTEVPFQDLIQHQHWLLVLRVQGDCLLHGDIFPEHFAYDNITER